MIKNVKDIRAEFLFRKLIVLIELEAPPALRAGLHFNQARLLLAQQSPPKKQQALPSQQSAVREVAVAVPIMARAVMIIKRIFMSSSCLSDIDSSL